MQLGVLNATLNFTNYLIKRIMHVHKTARFTTTVTIKLIITFTVIIVINI
jgi:hypothetical protein